MYRQKVVEALKRAGLNFLLSIAEDAKGINKQTLSGLIESWGYL